MSAAGPPQGANRAPSGGSAAAKPQAWGEHASAAPGWPGIVPRWTSSAKSGVGTACSAQSRTWFTLSHGIVNEVYFPRMDRANVRDLGLIVTDRQDFFSEEKRSTTSQIVPLAHGVPAYRIVNTCTAGRYRIVKRVLTDPHRNALLQEIGFEALRGARDDYAVYALLAPHVDNAGGGNDAWIGSWKGMPMLFARRNGTALALACSVPFRTMSCGYVGVSDGWQQLRATRTLETYTEARNGNVALTAELDFRAADGIVVLALGFGDDAAEAGHNARAALLRSFADHAADYVGQWEAFQRRCLDLSATDDTRDDGGVEFDPYRVSLAMLKVHQGKRFDGAMTASLSIPWGASKGDGDLGGYHLVWPRDLVEAAGGLLAAGDADGARQALLYLMTTQETDGHWPQNMWADGTPYWNGIQLDEAAFPILLADALHRVGELDGLDVWTMAKRAAGYIVCNGPATQEDRWEEVRGYSPFTLAVEIAALLAAADFADAAGERNIATYLRETADAWNAGIERWTYASGTAFARKCGVAGHYVRISPATDERDGAGEGPADATAASVVSVDALALVRFGLRAADDPRILDTVTVIDAVLRTQTKTGPVWHRYNGDRYGEHVDGAPYDGDGIGRGWPLLAGERAHYELAAGRPDAAAALGNVMVAQSSPGRLIPEQVWDADDVPARELFNGRPAGSAMPLVWAHAEYVKLCRSLRDGKVFDLPPQPVRRYQIERVRSSLAPWRMRPRCTTMRPGMTLRIEVAAASVVHWTTDEWRSITDTPTVDSTLGMHYADLPTSALSSGRTVRFTLRWRDGDRWQGEDFAVAVKT